MAIPGSRTDSRRVVIGISKPGSTVGAMPASPAEGYARRLFRAGRCRHRPYQPRSMANAKLHGRPASITLASICSVASATSERRATPLAGPAHSVLRRAGRPLLCGRQPNEPRDRRSSGSDRAGRAEANPGSGGLSTIRRTRTNGLQASHAIAHADGLAAGGLARGLAMGLASGVASGVAASGLASASSMISSVSGKVEGAVGV